MFLCIYRIFFSFKFRSIKIGHYFIRQTLCPLLFDHCHSNVRCIDRSDNVCFCILFSVSNKYIYCIVDSNWFSGFCDLFFQLISRLVVTMLCVYMFVSVCVCVFIHSIIFSFIYSLCNKKMLYLKANNQLNFIKMYIFLSQRNTTFFSWISQNHR